MSRSVSPLPADQVRPRVAELLHLWQDLTAAETQSLRDQETTADIAVQLAELYERLGDFTLADHWRDEGIRAYEPLRAGESANTLRSAGFAFGEGKLWSEKRAGIIAENQRRAIECYEQALRVYTREAAPAAWAMTQNNLGIAYQNLPSGDRAENLRRAIACYEQALTVYTREAAPADWAVTQNNLGIAYANLPSGDRAENLRRAIACYEQALTVRTREAAPADWAITQNNLGIAYADLPSGDRAENLRRAIACYENALRIWTEESFPHRQQLARSNLDRAQADLEKLDSAAVPVDA